MPEEYLLTVATKSYGLYDNLINNKFSYPVKTLGFGMEWEGFIMKFKLVEKYIKNLNDDDIIIFVDAFDTVINKNPKIAFEMFKKQNFKVLFSQDMDFENRIINFINNKIFKNKNHKIINSGLYMGQVFYIKKILKEILNVHEKYKTTDDQIAANFVYPKFKFVGLDLNKDIFLNTQIKNKDNKESVFISYPGQINITKRFFRGIKEYTQFFLTEIIILFCFIMLVSLFCLYKNKSSSSNYIVCVLVILFIFLFMYFYIDKSSIKIHKLLK